MTDKEAKDYINREYLHYTVPYKTEAQRIRLFEGWLQITREHKLEAYVHWLTGMIFYEKHQYQEAKAEQEKAIGLDSNFAFAYNEKGDAFWSLKEYPEAIKDYQKAIEFEPGYAYPWNGLGNVYDDLKDYHKAIEHFHKAIELDTSYAYPWHGLGNVYDDLNDYPKAIEHYQKTIELNREYSSPWNGLGYVYYALKDYPKAIEHFKKAIELEPGAATFWYNLSHTYFAINDFPKALEHFQTPLSLYEKEKDNYSIQVTKDKIEQCKKAIEAEQQTQKEKEAGIGLILAETDEMYKELIENKQEFNKFLEPGNQKKIDRDSLEVLRRWNSYTPIIADNYHISKGGGYFLHIKGEGIVIDPGFNFIDNFKGSGHYFYEIDKVFISHAHNDHTADLESILTLLHKYNENLKNNDNMPDDLEHPKTIRYQLAKEMQRGPDEITKEQIEEQFKNHPARKQIELFITPSVFKKYSGLLELFENKSNYTIHVIEAGNKFEFNGYSARVIPASHFDILSETKSVGLVFEIESSVLFYTGDTGFNENMEQAYKGLHEEYKDKQRILLAHIGGFKESEKFYFSQGYKCFYKTHLGRLGLFKACEALKPHICFISEFGEEFKSTRVKITQIFQKAFKDQKILFFPADIGLDYSFSDKTIKAIKSIDMKDFKLTKENYAFIDPLKVKAASLRRDYSLHYYEETIPLDDLIQLLVQEYDNSNK